MEALFKNLHFWHLEILCIPPHENSDPGTPISDSPVVRIQLSLFLQTLACIGVSSSFTNTYFRVYWASGNRNRLFISYYEMTASGGLRQRRLGSSPSLQLHSSFLISFASNWPHNSSRSVFDNIGSAFVAFSTCGQGNCEGSTWKQFDFSDVGITDIHFVWINQISLATAPHQSVTKDGRQLASFWLSGRVSITFTRVGCLSNIHKILDISQSNC